MDTPFRIFLFEDNDADVFLVRMAIDQAGLPFALTVCTDGEEAMTAVQRIESGEMESPDLLLLDMNLPVMDGWQAIRELRADPRTKAIPIIALTAHALADDRRRAHSWVALGRGAATAFGAARKNRIGRACRGRRFHAAREVG